MIEPAETRVAIAAMLDSGGHSSGIEALADLETIRFVVLDLMAERLGRLQADGCSDDDIASALRVDVIADHGSGVRHQLR